jgi:hypothetical protein
MVITKALALCLFIVGVIWAVVAAWINLVMSAISTPIVSYWLLLIIYFTPPLILILGSTFVMIRWHSRLGTFLILAACAWLTWSIAPDYIDLLHPKPPLQAPRPYLFLGIIAAVVLAADAAAVVLFRRVAKPSNQAMQPTADRRAERLRDDS